VAEAVAVEDGLIVYVGGEAGAARFVGPRTRTVDLAGGMLLPGFHDAHIHALEGGVGMDLCNLTGLVTADEIGAAVRSFAEAHPERDWVVGFGWSLAAFPEANPRREALDAVVPDRPAYLIGEDGHNAWVNTRALEVAGIDRDTPDPAKGRIERDPASGAPSGTLRETAMLAVQERAFAPGLLDALRGLRRAVAEANRHGITSFIEARATDASFDWVYWLADRLGWLRARVVLSLWVDPERGPEQVEDLVARRFGAPGDRLRADAVKLFADGVTEARSGYLLEPYLGKGGTGIPNFTPERLRELATRLDAAGFQLHVHAVGDAAVREALDAIEAARAANGPRDRRPHLAHLYLVDPADRPRFAALGVAANVQAIWAMPAPFNEELNLPGLGPARYAQLFPFASLARAGARIVAGSDWPVSTIDPLEAIQAAVTRRNPARPEAPPLGPDERLDLATMIAAYTREGAWLMRQEGVTGTIEVGKAADLVVLDRNLFELAPERLSEAKVLRTYLAGEEVWAAPEADSPR
jgi:predicted amidohydrolase YtcJ